MGIIGKMQGVRASPGPRGRTGRWRTRRCRSEPLGDGVLLAQGHGWGRAGRLDGRACGELDDLLHGRIADAGLRAALEGDVQPDRLAGGDALQRHGDIQRVVDDADLAEVGVNLFFAQREDRLAGRPGGRDDLDGQLVAVEVVMRGDGPVQAHGVAVHRAAELEGLLGVERLAGRGGAGALDLFG